MDEDEYPDPEDFDGPTNDDEAMAAEFDDDWGMADGPGNAPTAVEASADPGGAPAAVEVAMADAMDDDAGMDVGLPDGASEFLSSRFASALDAAADAPAEVDPSLVQARFTVPGHHGEVDGPGRDVEVLQLFKVPRQPLRVDTSEELARPIGLMQDDLEREKQALAARRPNTLPASAPTSSGLWVDRYSPKAFMELLSDERLNRQVLHWVKGWDAHVFGVKSKSHRATDDAYGQVTERPERPLLLLSGPPGLGKTTLVKVVAKHAGYRLMEINASDDRSAKVLKQKIKDATEVQPVFGSRKPVLVVLDEIDGAMGGGEGSGAIHELLRLASAHSNSGGAAAASASADGADAFPSSSKKGWDGLHRPVICICNDLWAPALRPLREVPNLALQPPPLALSPVPLVPVPPAS